MFCDVDVNKYAPEDRQRHYDEHLSLLDTLRAHELSFLLALVNLYSECEQHPLLQPRVHGTHLHP